MTMQNLSFKGAEVTGADLQKLLERCWTIQDLQDRFRVSGMTIHNYRNYRGLPAVVIPGDVRPALRFIPNEVAAWAKTNGIKMHPKR